MMKHLLVCLLFLVCLVSQPVLAQFPSNSLSSIHEDLELTWKVALMTGDDEIDAFDNARKALKNVFIGDGVLPAHIQELSMSRAERVGGVRSSSAAGLKQALQDLSVGQRDACLLHLTSHGTPEGFYMKRGDDITPSALNKILDQTCGDQPTVVLVSACYSGVFVGKDMMKPNRIILTAARSDRTSFGCSAEHEYTYWDACLIESFPQADTWKSLYGAVNKCVTTKESKSKFKPSLPQAYFGQQVADLRIPSGVAQRLMAPPAPKEP